MGLFDGAADGTGATADVAALFGLPVLLVVDVTGMGASVAALIDGFRRHREDVEVIGVILNRVASAGPRRAPRPRLLRACLHAGAGHDPARRGAGPAQPASGPGPGGRASRPRRVHRRRGRAGREPGSSSTGCSGWPARPASRSWAPTRGPGRRWASASPSRTTGRSPSPTPPCWMAGGGRGSSCACSLRWPTRRRTRTRTRSICPAAIPSCTRRLLAGNARFLGGLRAGRIARRVRLRRVRRVHDARARAGRPRGPWPRHGGAAAGGHQLRRAQAASRLPPDRAPGAQARWAMPAASGAATSSTMPARSSREGPAAVSRPLRARPRRGRAWLRRRPSRRLVPAPDRSRDRAIRKAAP